MPLNRENCSTIFCRLNSVRSFCCYFLLLIFHNVWDGQWQRNLFTTPIVANESVKVNEWDEEEKRIKMFKGCSCCICFDSIGFIYCIYERLRNIRWLYSHVPAKRRTYPLFGHLDSNALPVTKSSAQSKSKPRDKKKTKREKIDWILAAVIWPKIRLVNWTIKTHSKRLIFKSDAFKSNYFEMKQWNRDVFIIAMLFNQNALYQ